MADPSTLGSARQKAASYSRSASQAAAALAETVRRAGLTERQVRLLHFAAQNPEVLSILDSIQSLLVSTTTDAPALKVAED